MKKFYSTFVLHAKLEAFWVCLILIVAGKTHVQGQTFFDMSTANYSQDFADIANWTNNYAAGNGAANWRVATSVATSTVNAAGVFVSGTSGGVQKGTQALIILATGTNSSATDLLLNMTGRTAGTISLDWAKVTNTVNASPRSSDLKIQYSVDNGVTFTDLTGYTIPRVLNNSTAESGSLSNIALPAALNNQAQVVIRFYVWNNGQTGGSGNRPKISIDNIAITSTAAGPSVPTVIEPTVTNITPTTALLGGNITNDGGASITERGSVRGVTNNPTGNKQAATLGSGTGIFTHTHTGLTANTRYIFRAFGQNSAGIGYSANTEFFTLHNAPNIGTGSDATFNSIQANWTAPNGPAGTVTFTYELEVYNNSNLIPANLVFSESNINASLTSFVATGLAASTTHYFRVRAVNTTGPSAWSATSAAYSTLAPPAQTITVTGITGAPFNLPNCATPMPGTVTYTTSANFNVGNVFSVELSDGSGSFAAPIVIGSLTAITSGTINFDIPAAQPSGTGYLIRVVATNPVVSSNNSSAFAINTPNCNSSSTDFFRSVQNGNWNQITTWESSSDNISWIPATLTPTDASSAIVISENDTVKITANVNIDQTTVMQNAVLEWIGGTAFKIQNGAGDDLVVYGTFKHNLSAAAPYQSGAAIRIKTGGTLEVNNNGTSASHYGTSNQIFYEHHSVLWWKMASISAFTTAGVTYFPNSSANEVPIFRYESPNVFVGAGGATTINGIFEVAGSSVVTWQNAGVKTFRNGLASSGTAAIIQNTNCGAFVINGDSAIINCATPLTLNATNSTNRRINTGTNTYLALNANTVINTSTSGGALRILGNSQLDLGNFSLTGTADLLFESDATIITANLNGFNATDIAPNLVTFSTPNRQNFVYNGTNTNQVSGTTLLPNEFGTLTVKNGTTLDLEKDLTINNFVHVENGEIKTQAFEITLTDTAKVIEPNNRVNGKVKTTRVVSQNTKESFGDLGLAINPANATMGSTLMVRVTGTALEGGTGPVNNNTSNYSIPVYYEVTPTTNANLQATIEFSYKDSEINPIAKSDLAFFKRPINGTTWTTIATVSNDVNNNLITAIVENFSIVTLGNINTPLPVSGLMMQAKLQDADILITWQTQSEINNHFFELEHSNNGAEYQVIGSLRGNGTTNNEHNYVFLHEKPQGINHFYRIKQVDYDGNFTHSKVLFIKKRLAQISIYPNPTNGLLHFSGIESEITVQIFDLQGKLLFEKRISNAQNQIQLPILPNGMYWLRGFGATENIFTKIFVHN